MNTYAHDDAERERLHLAAEETTRATEARGHCPHAGMSIARCWATDTCDCSWGAPIVCHCGTAVWDLVDHVRRMHT